jgi:hypothetical protein
VFYNLNEDFGDERRLARGQELQTRRRPACFSRSFGVVRDVSAGFGLHRRWFGWVQLESAGCFAWHRRVSPGPAQRVDFPRFENMRGFLRNGEYERP